MRSTVPAVCFLGVAIAFTIVVDRNLRQR